MIQTKEEILAKLESGVSVRSIVKNPEFSEFILHIKSKYHNCKIVEGIYLYIRGIESKPKFECCGKTKMFISFEAGYGDVCFNRRCSVGSSNYKEKVRMTSLKKYGVENPMQSEYVRNKTRQTNMERYNGHPSKTKEVKDKLMKTNMERYGCHSTLLLETTQHKIQQTNIERYGAENPFGSKEIQNRIRQTNIERYGFENPMQSEQIQDKTRQTNVERYGSEVPMRLERVKESVKSTNMERYGFENPMQSKLIREKTQRTIMERYGVSHQSQSKEFRESYKRTSMERYGVENPMQAEEVLEKTRIVKWNNYYSRNKDLLKFIPQDPSVPLKEGHSVTWKCCGHVSEYIDYNGPMSARCPICDPPLVNGTSRAEQEIFNFIKEIYTGDVINGDRNVIYPKELDIYIPDRNLAIEYNGVYWHSSGSIEEDQFFETRHYNKTLLCGERGINLFHVSEFDWQNVQKKEIIKSMIRHKLGSSSVVHARKTEVREVSPSDSREFLERNHLQGNVNAKIRLGLYHDNVLVSLMTFGKPRFNKNFEWELLRFSSSLNTSISGGASKLLKHFRTHHTGSIISYANRDHSLGTLYQNLGFELISESYPSYVWLKEGKQYSRYETQKHKLKNLLGDGFDENLTEAENMYKNGFRRVFDSGNWVFGLM